MGKKIDMIGRRFGRLTVVRAAKPYVAPCGTRSHRVRVRCACGTTKVVYATNLTKGLTRSCGCLRREITSARSRKHGDAAAYSMTPEYKAHSGMIQRCENPRNRSYQEYGGRGIRVCARWRRSFIAFLADVGRRPSTAHSLDRFPNNDGHYEPGNVRWATRKDQANNRRKRRKKRR